MKKIDSNSSFIPLYLENDISEEALNFYSFMNSAQLQKIPQDKIGGDLVFNFKKGKTNLLNVTLKKEGKYKVDTKKLIDLNRLSVNCSFMIKTGNMNNTKSQIRVLKQDEKSKELVGDLVMNNGVKLDRADAFIHLLNEYYLHGDIRIFSNATNQNINELNSYLRTFNDVYDYCKSVYNLVLENGDVDKELVNKLIKNGNDTIHDSLSIYSYISCAVEFWNCRIRYINKRIDQDKLKCGIFEEIELSSIIYKKG